LQIKYSDANTSGNNFQRENTGKPRRKEENKLCKERFKINPEYSNPGQA
jgi:hypothetical protein